jgi:uncharacterized protein YggT (Ycf19 family)
MGLIDFILNLAAVLLWLTWRSTRFDPLRRTSVQSLAGTLRRAEPLRLRRWHYLAGLVILLFGRAVLYHQIGPVVNWTAHLDLTCVSVSFRSSFFSRMLVYSVTSFLVAWAVFYLWLLLFSLVNRNLENPLQKLVRWHLGRFDRWPVTLKLLLPFLLAALLWLALNPLLRVWEIVPPTTTIGHVSQQAALIGLGVYLVWKYALGAVLAFYLLSSYIYLGQHPVWEFVEQTGATFVRPLRKLPLRLGKVDFAPVVGIAILFLLAEGIERGLILTFKRLPL